MSSPETLARASSGSRVPGRAVSVTTMVRTGNLNETAFQLECTESRPFLLISTNPFGFPASCCPARAGTCLANAALRGVSLPGWFFHGLIADSPPASRTRRFRLPLPKRELQEALLWRNSGRPLSGELTATRIRIMKRQKHAPIVTWLTALALLVSMCAGLAFNQH